MSKENKPQGEGHGLHTAGTVLTVVSFIIFIAGIVCGFFNMAGGPSAMIPLVFICCFVGVILSAIGNALKRRAVRSAPARTLTVVSAPAEARETERAEEARKGLTCPHCGMRNNADSEFCANCGASLHRKCPFCGEEVSLTAKFCDHCGKKL